MSVSDEDKALFKEAMKGATPLNTPKKVETYKARVKPLKREPIRFERDDTPLSDTLHEEVGAETLLSYHHAGLPIAQFKRLKQGEFPIDGTLDLHGFTGDEARQALLQFIKKHAGCGHRVLLIIHGKGLRSNSPPVIKNLLNTWLHQLPNILAFHSALPQDGGRGAVYVLLKRSRD